MVGPAVRTSPLRIERSAGHLKISVRSTKAIIKFTFNILIYIVCFSIWINFTFFDTEYSHNTSGASSVFYLLMLCFIILMDTVPSGSFFAFDIEADTDSIYLRITPLVDYFGVSFSLNKVENFRFEPRSSHRFHNTFIKRTILVFDFDGNPKRFSLELSDKDTQTIVDTLAAHRSAQ